MPPASRRPFGQNYAFVVAGAIFLALLAAAGLRAAPGVLILPLEKAFGWDRGSISLAAAVGIFLYGLTGPFAAALMQSFGLRKTVTLALLVMSVSTGLSAFMSQSWQYVATWGVLADSIEPLAPPPGAPPLVAFHGDDDQRVPVALARGSIERFTKAGWAASLRSFPHVGHSIGADERRALFEAIGAALPR